MKSKLQIKRNEIRRLLTNQDVSKEFEAGTTNQSAFKTAMNSENINVLKSQPMQKENKSLKPSQSSKTKLNTNQKSNRNDLQFLGI